MDRNRAVRHSSDSSGRAIRAEIELRYDTDAEEVVLGTALQADTNDVQLLADLTREHFSDQRREVFDAIRELQESSRAVDALAVKRELDRRGRSELHALTTTLLNVSATYEPNAMEHLSALRQLHAQRELQRVGNDLIQVSNGSDLSQVPHTIERLRAIERDAGVADSDPVVDAATFVRQANIDQAPLWGQHDSVLWTPGETLWICGPTGVGKTTIAQQLALARVGLLPELLGFPVERDQGRLLYIAADRPKQAARSLARMVSDDELSVFAELCVVWQGPLLYDLAAHPSALIELAHRVEAGTVLIDSLKDVALDLSKDEAGSRVNYALNAAVSAGIEVVVLHHQRKSQQGRKPTTLEDVYGSTWLTAGAGSVVLLWGRAGDPIVELTHLKQPVGDVGPLRIIHDQRTGRSSVIDQPDLVELARFSRDGLTARDAARHLWDKDEPEKNDVEKARRRLDGLSARGLLVRHEGDQGGSGDARNPARWYATTRREGPPE